MLFVGMFAEFADAEVPIHSLFDDVSLSLHDAHVCSVLLAALCSCYAQREVFSN